jgi:cyanophycinase-like exopeptidase
MARPDRTAVEQQQQRTLARLEAVKHHFDTAQSAGRFANKVAIVTGVGSLKGIGSVYPTSAMVERLC